MIQSRLGEGEGWKEEWVGEVQKLLGMDAGWGWVGFWDCVRRNLEVWLFLPLLPLSVLPHSRFAVRRYVGADG